jgi:DNA-binding transcriptional regulator YhcF (GntR family)
MPIMKNVCISLLSSANSILRTYFVPSTSYLTMENRGNCKTIQKGFDTLRQARFDITQRIAVQVLSLTSLIVWFETNTMSPRV